MARLRPQHTELIVNALLSLKNNGKAESTVNSVNECLTRISKNVDLTNPESVKTYIAHATKKNGEPIENASKAKLAFAYNCLRDVNQIQLAMPRYKVENARAPTT